MHTLRLTERFPCELLAGRYVTEANYDHLIGGESATVYKPDGSLLLLYVAGALDRSLCAGAFECLHRAASKTANRGAAAGVEADTRTAGGKVAMGEKRFRRIKKDGTVSKTNHAAYADSGVCGFMDSNPRFPYCRTTSYVLNNPERFAAAIPFVRAVDDVFRKHDPQRHAAQADVASRTHPAWLIPGTAFTTITVNKNFRTAVHKDAGDYRAGRGVLTVLSRGDYAGGHLVFPEFRVAADLRPGGVLLADVHEWHGNTALRGRPGFARVSCVFYYREKMVNCGSPEEEIASARTRRNA